MTARVLLVDPDGDVRAKLQPLGRDLERVAAHELEEHLRDDDGRVVVADIGTHLAGIELCRELHDRYPRMRCVVFAALPEDEALLRAVLSGAAASVSPETPPAVAEARIRSVSQGATPVQQQIAASNEHAASRHGPEDDGSLLECLTERQRLVLELVAAGHTNREIGERLHLSRHTVRNYLSEAMHRLGVENRTQAAALLVALDPAPLDGPVSVHL